MTKPFSLTAMSVKKSLHHMLDILFPPTEDQMIVRELTENDINVLYKTYMFQNIQISAQFADRKVRALLHEAKFHHNQKALHMAGLLLDRLIGPYVRPDTICIPVPLSKTRLRQRGYNQVLEILRSSRHAAEASVNNSALIRTRDTKPQTDLPRHERLLNVADAFVVQDPEVLLGRQVFLIDDVVTTGATLAAAKNALLKCGPESVTCFAVAH